MVTVRLQKKPSKELIYSLDARCFPDDERPWFTDRLWWLACDGDKPVGYASLKLLGFEEAYLYRAGVIPSYRGKGIHSLLIRRRVDYARRKGLRALVTYATKDNYGSLTALIKSGFRFYDPDWAWAGRGGVMYLMQELGEVG